MCAGHLDELYKFLLVKLTRMNMTEQSEKELFSVTHILTLAILTSTFKNTLFEGIVHPKMKLWSTFIHFYVVPNPHDFLSFLLMFLHIVDVKHGVVSLEEPFLS